MLRLRIRVVLIYGSAVRINAGLLRMQAQQSRTDQSHWQDVIAVNQNDPIQTVACTSLVARLETWTRLTTILYSV
jgi:hypothetical protein